MTKHTPGPWRLNGTLITAQDDMAVKVASVHGGAIGAVPALEQEANARLIAAAPELLETASTIADMLVADGGEATTRLRALRVAIAKATGTAG